MALNSSTSTCSVIGKKTDNCIGFLDANLEVRFFNNLSVVVLQFDFYNWRMLLFTEEIKLAEYCK